MLCSFCFADHQRRYIMALLAVGSLVWGSWTASAQSDLIALSKDPKNWVMAPRDYGNTRFSNLDQITASNVNQLKLAWSFSVGPSRGQEAAPLVINGTMYVVAPYDGPHPNQVFALEASNGN